MNWDYLAGFFDGEGTARIGCTSNSLGAIFQIAQSGDRGYKLLVEIADFLEQAGVSRSTIYSPKHIKMDNVLSKKPMWFLHLYKRSDVELVLNKLLPLCRIKKCEIQDILRFSKLNPPLKNNPLLNNEAAIRRRLPVEESKRRQRERERKWVSLNREKVRAANRRYKAKIRKSSPGCSTTSRVAER